MAWVRIDDQAPRNTKMLRAGPAACWLWVCGIAHCQSQLTDGFISLDVLPMIGIAGGPRVRRLAEQLVSAGLFERADGGYQVHDYLHHNESRAKALARRALDAARKGYGIQPESERNPAGIRTESSRNPNGIQPESEPPRTGARAPTPASHPIPSVPIRSKEERTGADARSNRPIFDGQRLTVFEWQLTNCLNTLGPDADGFDLHDWFFELDRRAVADGLVIPKRDGGAWLQAQLVAEAQRRGLALRMATTDAQPQAGKLTTRLASALKNIAAEGTH